MFSDYLKPLVLRDRFVTPNVWLALHTEPTTGAGGGAEGGYDDYARQQVDFQEPVNGSVTINTEARFPANDSGAAMTFTHASIWDADNAGNMLAHGEMTAPLVVPNGSPVIFDPNALTVSLG